jgi:hypothetical protein
MNKLPIGTVIYSEGYTRVVARINKRLYVCDTYGKNEEDRWTTRWPFETVRLFITKGHWKIKLPTKQIIEEYYGGNW